MTSGEIAMVLACGLDEEEVLDIDAIVEAMNLQLPSLICPPFSHSQNFRHWLLFPRILPDVYDTCPSCWKTCL